MDEIEKKLKEKGNWGWSGNIYQDEEEESISLLLTTPWSNHVRLCVQVDVADGLSGIVPAFEFMHLDHVETKLHRNTPYIQPQCRFGNRTFEARLPQDRFTETAFRLVGGFLNSSGHIVSGPAIILEMDQILLTYNTPEGKKFSGRFKTAGLRDKLENALTLMGSDMDLDSILHSYNSRLQRRFMR